jgi:hypothetical protein
LRINSAVHLEPMRLKVVFIGAGERALTATIAVLPCVVSAMVLEQFEITKLIRAESALKHPLQRRNYASTGLHLC